MHQIAPESCTIDQCEKWVWQNSKPQKVSQTGDESAGRLAQSYGVLAPTVSPFYHKLTTLLIEEEETTGMPFPSTAWQQSLLLVLDLSNFYQIQPTACKPPNPSLSLALFLWFFFHTTFLGFFFGFYLLQRFFFVSLFVFLFLCHSFFLLSVFFFVSVGFFSAMNVIHSCPGIIITVAPPQIWDFCPLCRFWGLRLLGVA